MIRSLLIANRGEIACRIIRTARAMGMRTVAVHSDADARALHVRKADQAVHIGPSPAAESYLRGDRIIAAALETGAEAIHPGYGFLSENAEFAEAVIAAGLVWVGPHPASIRAMGLKDAAKQLMRAAGVPVTPGYDGADQSAGRLAAEAEAIGYPVLIKAVAGGGGKGMRKVDSPADFNASLESCRREAQASFGNDQVLLEKWITSPRHIEVQVFGDTHGNVVHLFERDCSLQRRHQKVIEEAPAPGMDAATREAICGAAVRAAKAVDYIGAGTIEFIADASQGLSADRIFFMEMNTRLQVEHPVTEEITGVDLVEWQLRVASGEPLSLKQEDLSINGHAIEARLYAEDPAKGFLPSTGRLERFRIGTTHAGEDSSLRIEAGVDRGDEISPFYDPMIAKIIAHGPDRDLAGGLLFDCLRHAEVWPVRTNAAFLSLLVSGSDFLSASLDTGLIERRLDRLAIDIEPPRWLLEQAADKLASRNDTPAGLQGFRINASEQRTVALTANGRHCEARFGVPQASAALEAVSIEEVGEALFATTLGTTWRITERRSDVGSIAATSTGAIIAPMPGKVIALDVAEGQRVTMGQRLMVLEAMKMEHALTAPFDGVVAELNAAPGAQVQVDALLARVEKD